jgi:hypothetical protein
MFCLTLTLIRSWDGSCLIDHSEDGGYVKTATNHKLHITAAVTGTCRWRVPDKEGNCQNSTLYYRVIGTSWLYVDLTNWGSVPVYPSNTLTIQNYSTIGSINTLSTGATYSTGTLGPHVLSSTTNASATACLLTPTTFEQNHTITFNALKCEPKFNNPTGNTHRVGVPTPPDKVKVYLPAGLASYIESELDTAISTWNAQIGATGVQYLKVAEDCGTGPDCIKPEPVTFGSCGFSVWDTPPSSGIIPGGLRIQVLASMTNWTSAEKTRTLMHELGHFLGLRNYASAPNCGASDAMMQPDFSCNTQSTPATTLSINDYLPVVNTVYGGKSKKACGF